ncbi:MAG TPA: hypothetical protein VMJ73_17230 [Rhizomicrobium sp.]|nr:hypothetical protein [Rhizomicrobium sp.]
MRFARASAAKACSNRSTTEQWKNYEPWLGALRDALADAPQRYRG